MNPHQLGGGHPQHPAHFFGTQHRDSLNFYPLDLRNRFHGNLLPLERAFEKNHYVVGAERKQLANCLILSET
ncbi:unnamed protein product, partial [Coregonus sp. 'balchen']